MQMVKDYVDVFLGSNQAVWWVLHVVGIFEEYTIVDDYQLITHSEELFLYIIRGLFSGVLVLDDGFDLSDVVVLSL